MNSKNSITTNTQVWKKYHVAPTYPNQDLVVFEPNRGIHPLSGDFKKCDVKWLLAEIKVDCDFMFGISA